ncbi:hypothetical protein F5Y15DRAFT_91587 [Xylariaceae sp. FL0016]|nr:hypothetical protein F5Y15DRAFT_91587 [Xylariaceae sp. FL0016]
MGFSRHSIATFMVAVLPFSSGAPTAPVAEERAIASPPKADVVARSAPIAAGARPLDGRALEDKRYEGVDVRLRAENLSHGG